VADTLQFVDSIASSPTVRLDLNDDTLWGFDYDGSDFSPPSIRRAYADTLLVDGARIPAAAYDNRRLQLRLDLKTSTVDAAATQIQKLGRELDRAANILTWKPGTSEPVFFRTFRSPINRITEVPGPGTYKTFDVSVEAEPFALGLRESVGTLATSTNPAAAGGCFMDVTGVKGDVETPLILRRSTTNRGDQSLFAVRRRSTPSATPFLAQAESLTQGTNTTTQSNSATFSGSGNNYSRCTFGTASWATRLSANPYPASASVDARGTYRVFARLRKNGTSGTVQVRFIYGGAATMVTGEAVTVTWTTPAMLDLGLVAIPIGSDPVHDGYSAVELSARGIFMGLDAQRTSGTDTLDVDYFLFVPADDRLAIVNWSDDAGAADALYLDATHDMSYGVVLATGIVVSMTPGWHVGALPMISPAVTNRIFHINEVAPATAEPSWPTTISFDAWYFPRYLYVRPAST
jgi:hypothetical protein